MFEIKKQRLRFLLAFFALFLPMSSHAWEKLIRGPQATLPVTLLTITDEHRRAHEFQVEVARDPQQQRIGLMYRTYLAPNRGMLFVWSVPQRIEMWMRHTLIPLDILFISPNGVINAIEENAVPQSEIHIPGYGLSIATLELPGGTTRKIGITVGSHVDSTALNRDGR